MLVLSVKEFQIPAHINHSNKSYFTIKQNYEILLENKSISIILNQ